MIRQSIFKTECTQGPWAVQSAPKVFLWVCLGLWQNSHDVPQQRLYSFKGSLDPFILVVSVVLF